MYHVGRSVMIMKIGIFISDDDGCYIKHRTIPPLGYRDFS